MFDNHCSLQENAGFVEMHGEKREWWVVVRKMAEDEDADVCQVFLDEYKLQPYKLAKEQCAWALLATDVEAPGICVDACESVGGVLGKGENSTRDGTRMDSFTV